MTYISHFRTRSERHEPVCPDTHKFEELIQGDSKLSYQTCISY